MSYPPLHHLIDVRSPAEFATGHLSAWDTTPTLNIDYQAIAQLDSLAAARGITVRKHDRITLYCRSGRRSGIALTTLRGLGFERVRDLGGLEDARRVLDREMVGRQLEEGIQGIEGEGEGGGGCGGEGRGDEGGVRGRARVQSFGRLVEGLRELEG